MGGASEVMDKWVGLTSLFIQHNKSLDASFFALWTNIGTHNARHRAWDWGRGKWAELPGKWVEPHKEGRKEGGGAHEGMYYIKVVIVYARGGAVHLPTRLAA